MKGQLLSSAPTTFRAELRAILQAFNVSGMDVMVKSDCKSAVNIVNKIADEGKWDSKHHDADIME